MKTSELLLVTCPTCMAAPGEACGRGQKVDDVHVLRIAAAAAHHEQQARRRADRAAAVRDAAAYIEYLHPNGLTSKAAVLADLEVAADRISRGIRANGLDVTT